MLRSSVYKNSRALTKLLQQRGFHSTSNVNAASVFGMPAMSPTMDQGGIIKWHFKEGDSYLAGDSLLEVETDKATIDVEAQDDGKLVKIIFQEGAKDIPVGKPIAILAEPTDDLATLELPKIEEGEAAPTPAAAPAPAPTPAEKKSEPLAHKSHSPSPSATSTKANPAQKFFPSVELLLEQNHISREEALEKIEATAPNGRITKGDVLAFLGKISKDSVNSISSFIESKKHLDLSNIQIKAPEPKADAAAAAKAAKPSKPAPVNVSKSFILSLPISHAQLLLVVKSASKIAEQYAYLSPTYGPSDLNDPIFEDLIAPPHNAERFKISVKLNEPSSAPAAAPSQDPFDDLLGLSSAPAAATAAALVALPSVDVDLTINGKVLDSKKRAELFISKFGELLATPQKEASKVEEFDF